MCDPVEGKIVDWMKGLSFMMTFDYAYPFPCENGPPEQLFG